jgi:hypothetical protein
MKKSSRSTPHANVANVDRLAMIAVTHPATKVARAPMARRASIIGRVKVMASATAVYSRHAPRMITPTMVTMTIHTATPATTPRNLLAIPCPF